MKNEIDLNKKILEQLPTPVMAINPDFDILFMNYAGFDLLKKG